MIPLISWRPKIFRKSRKNINFNNKTEITMAKGATKSENRHIKLTNSSLCLNSLIDRLYKQFLNNPVYIHKKSSIEFKYEKLGVDITIMCDKERLIQVLINLIDNALKITEKGEVKFGYSISINDCSDYQYITFYVKDSGIGIPKDKTEKIFDPFFQFDGSTSAKYNTMSLGLAISKKLVNLMNGKIWCKSDVKEGSCFYVSIPYIPAYSSNCWVNWEHKIEPFQGKNDTDIDWSDFTTLIVEDDPFCFKLLEKMLRNTKVNIIHSDNGAKAVEQVIKNPQINLVLMDINLPEMNGWSATKNILKINPKLPIIAQTTNESEPCLEAGCIDYIKKPIEMRILFNKMAKFLV